MKALTAKLAMLLLLVEQASAARSYGHIIVPRNYEFNRRSNNAFDLLTEVMSAPVSFENFANTMIRQHHAAVSRLANSAPRYDVSFDEEAGNIELHMEVPGVSSKDISIELEDNKILRIHGSRKVKTNGDIIEAKFDQTFELHSEADPETLKASVANGILTVQAQKRERATRKIEVVDTVVHENEAIEAVPGRESSEEAGISITED